MTDYQLRIERMIQARRAEHEEQRLVRKLAFRLIAVGYKRFIEKGGDARLANARDLLKKSLAMPRSFVATPVKGKRR